MPASSVDIIVYIQESYYLEKLKLVLKEIPHNQVTYVSKNYIPGISKSIQINPKNLFQLILFLLKRNKFDLFLVANIDDFFFQVMFRFLRYKDLITFDEGQRSVIQGDRYFAKVFPLKKNKRNKILNRLFGFPLPLGKYYDYSIKHFTFYDPAKINHNLSHHKELLYVQNPIHAKKAKKIFIGISSNWRFFKNGKLGEQSIIHIKKLENAAEIINKINPDIYLCHPREDEKLISLLNEDILVLRELNGKSHKFVNMLASTDNIEVYNDRSGVLFDLANEIKVNLVDIFERFDSEEYSAYFNNLRNFRMGMGSSYHNTELIKKENLL